MRVADQILFNKRFSQDVYGAGKLSSSRLQSREQGAVIVESVGALAFWLFLLVCLVNAGALLTTYYSINQAARDALVQAAKYPLPRPLNITFNIPGNPQDCGPNILNPISPTVGQNRLLCKIENMFHSAIRGKNMYFWVPGAAGVPQGRLTLNGNNLTATVSGRFRGIISIWPAIPIDGVAQVEYIWPPFQDASLRKNLIREPDFDLS